MQPNTLASLRWIVGVCLLSGCYSPWMNSRQGYGYSPYGGAYGTYPGAYGGYQGIQTLTPGQYYAPGTTTPTYAPNGLEPTPDAGTSGSGGTSNPKGSGGDAPPYNPGTVPSRPVPNTPYYGDPATDSNGQFEPPISDAPIRENNLDNGQPSTMSEPSRGKWATEKPIEQVGVRPRSPEPSGALEELEIEAVEAVGEPVEAAPLFQKP